MALETIDKERIRKALANKASADRLIDLLDGLSPAELDALDGVTAGTAAASKALVLGSSKEISVITTAGITNVDVGASGTAGTLDVFPGTASKGKIAITATANTNNDTLSITNAAMGQATTLTIPDPGGASASFVLTVGTQTVTGAKTLTGGLTVTTTGVTITDVDVALGTTTGTKFGTSASQKLAFFNATPVVQPASADQAALTNSTGGAADGTLAAVGATNSGDVSGAINDNFTELYTLLTAIRTALVDLGIVKGAA